MKRYLLLMLLTIAPARTMPAAAEPVAEGNLAVEETLRATALPIASDQVDPAVRGRNGSLQDWWERSKRALHHLSGCALASAGLTYALIAGVAFPGAALLGLTGAAIVVLMCL
jgi:hypothetical protein